MTAPTLTVERRLFAAAAPTHARHLQQVGPVPELSAEQIVRLATESGLTGRGGAAFPAGRKLAAVAAGRDAVVVANGAEGEPASSKDRALLRNAPHLVLDGLALAARATRATRAYLYAPQDLLDTVLARAVRERADRLPVTLVAARETFVSGQETAVVAAIEGRPALPRVTPPPVFVRGVGNRPTLVQNVETLAHLALVARHGTTWFRSAGTDAEPGTRLVTVSGAVQRPAVYEVPGGSPLGWVLGLAGGFAEPVQAVLVGGYHGGWVPYTEHTVDLPLDREHLAPYDAAPGAGVLVALPSRRCGLQAGADLAAYLAGQNAGQCGPCRNGLPTLAGHLHTLAYGAATRDLVREVGRVTGLVDGRGACAHPNGTVRMVRSTLRTFDAEVRDHLAGRCTGRQTTGPSTGRAR